MNSRSQREIIAAKIEVRMLITQRAIIPCWLLVGALASCGPATTASPRSPAAPPVEVTATPAARAPDGPPTGPRAWRFVPQRAHQRDGVWGLGFTADGATLVSSSKDRSVRVWDAVTGRVRAVIPTGGQVADDVDVNADGTRIAVAGYMRVRLIDTATGAVLPGYENPDGWVSSVAFHPTDSLLAAGGMRQVRLWDTSNGTLVDTIAGLPDDPRALEWSRDGALLALGMGRAVWVWDVKAKKRRHELGPVGVLAWHLGWLGGGVLAAADGGGVRLWDATSGGSVAFLSTPGLTRGIAASPDSGSVAACHDRSVTLLDRATGSARWTSSFASADAKVVSFSPKGDALAIGADNGALRVVDAKTGAARFDVPVFDGAFDQVQLTPGGLGLVRTRAGSVLIEGTSLRVRQSWEDAPVWLAPGGASAVVLQDDGLVVLDLAGGAAPRTLPRPAWAPAAVAVSHDGRMLAAASPESGVLRTLDLKRAHPAPRDTRLEPPVMDMAFTPSGKRLIANVAGISPILIELASGKTTALEQGDGRDTYSAAWSQEGSQLATWGGGKLIKLRDPETAAVLRTLQANVDVRAVALGVSSLASLGGDGRVSFWDTERGAVAREAETGATEPLRLALSSDGRFAVVVSPTELRWVRKDDGAVLIVDWVARREGAQPIAAMDGGRCWGAADQLDGIVFRDGPDLVRGQLATCKELGESARRESLVRDFLSGGTM